MANNVSGTTITLRHEWPASASGLATFSVTSSAKTQRNTNGATKNSAIRTSQPPPAARAPCPEGGSGHATFKPKRVSLLLGTVPRVSQLIYAVENEPIEHDAPKSVVCTDSAVLLETERYIYIYI